MLKNDFSRRALIASGGVATVAIIAERADLFAGAKSAPFRTTLEAHGGGTSSVDNSAALRAAFAELKRLGGGVLDLSEGTYRFASSALGGVGAEMPSNTELAGRGKGRTRLVVTGAQSCHFLLNEHGASNHLVRDLSVRGNGTASGNGPGGAYWCSVLEGRAKSGVRNCRFRSVRFENFGGDAWIAFLCTSSRFSIDDCGVERGCEFISHKGNVRNPDSLAVRSTAIEFNGDGAGVINDPFVIAPVMDLTFLKSGISCFSNVNRMRIEDPILNNCGQGHRTPDKGWYAIILYDSTGYVREAVIERPVIANPFGCGIYIAATTGTRIVSPRIYGQADVADGTLPKAAIALNGPVACRVIQPDLGGEGVFANRQNIAIVLPGGQGRLTYPANMDLRISGGKGIGAQDYGITVKPSANIAAAGGISIVGYQDFGGAADTAIAFFQIPGRSISNVTIDGGRYAGVNYCINANRAGRIAHASHDWRIRNVRFDSAGISSVKLIDFAPGARIRIENCIFSGRPSAHHVEIDDLGGIFMAGNRFAATARSGDIGVDGRGPG